MSQSPHYRNEFTEARLYKKADPNRIIEDSVRCISCSCIFFNCLQKVSLNSDGKRFQQYQRNKQSPLSLTHVTHSKKFKRIIN